MAFVLLLLTQCIAASAAPSSFNPYYAAGQSDFWRNITAIGRKFTYNFQPKPRSECVSFLTSLPDVQGLGHAQANRNFGLMLAASLSDIGVCYAYSPLHEQAKKLGASSSKGRLLSQWESFLRKPAAWPDFSDISQQFTPIKLHATGHTALLRHHNRLRDQLEANKTYVFINSDTFDHCPTSSWWGDYYLDHRKKSSWSVKALLPARQHQVLQVAVHLRRFDITTIATKSKRVHKDTFFQNVLRELKTLVPDPWKVAIHVMTSSLFPRQAAVLKRSVNTLYTDATLHLNNKDTDTFHAFVTADILIMDWSRFSHLAGLWSKGIKITSGFRYATDCDVLWVPATEVGVINRTAFQMAWQAWQEQQHHP